MNEQLKYDQEDLASLLEKVKKQGIAFLDAIEDRPTSVITPKLSTLPLNENGFGGESTLELFNQRFEKIMVAATGPRYWGYVVGGATPAAIMGDWLATIYDQNPQAIAGQGDVSALIEIETIQLILDLFGLPNDFSGGFVTGATMSNFTCLAVARQWFGKQQGKDFAKDGISEKIRIFSAVPHSSTIKSLSMLGIGSNNFEQVPVLAGNREAIDLEALELQIASLVGQPFILITSAGTVNTVDFDDFVAIEKLRQKYKFWWHIDAAFGAFAACSPAYKHLVKGWETADSITIDCHKWLNVPYENAVFLIKEKYQRLQVETFQNSNAPYLGDPQENFNFLNFLPENSRRLRALPVWFSLKAYGKKGYREIVENAVDLAKQLGTFVENDSNFELLAPVRLNTVCFTLAGAENQNKVVDFLSKVNATAKVFMTPTVYNGKKGIRAAFVNWRTTSGDVDMVIEVLKNLKT
ncbi:pyridoxal phosphate-dependent decarboxylase family protein [Flavobacterium sp. 7A]|uniref:pyridoxal phosphate-dependent decarboxylase family protein n=1 Tax=Flavobacterium sp. 7A TaxID=2940571 RepID=UPI0022261157|nr:pyridoxal-dependent decarboxylase [Flavobacterium sp. 7A]MCW2117995.1 glutamate/tyrosine decarboxylase-like PLP-dependent enzyme [Flavobacterium sp. 7A]